MAQNQSCLGGAALDRGHVSSSAYGGRAAGAAAAVKDVLFVPGAASPYRNGQANLNPPASPPGGGKKGALGLEGAWERRREDERERREREDEDLAGVREGIHKALADHKAKEVEVLMEAIMVAKADNKALVARLNAAEAEKVQSEATERELSLLKGEVAVLRATASGFKGGEAALRSSLARAQVEAQEMRIAAETMKMQVMSLEEEKEAASIAQSAAKSRRQKMEDECGALRQALAVAEAGMSAARGERDVALSRLSGVERERDGAAASLVEARKENNVVRGELERSETTREMLRGERDAAIQERDALSESRGELLGERDQLLESISVEREAQGALESRLAEASLRISSFTRVVADLEAKLSAETARGGDAERRASDLEKQLEAQNLALEKAAARAKELEAHDHAENYMAQNLALERAVALAKKLEDQNLGLALANAELGAARGAWEEERTKLVADAQAGAEYNARLEEERRRREEERGAWEEERGKLMVLLKAQDGADDGKITDGGEVLSLRREVEELRGRIAPVEGALGEAHETIASLERALQVTLEGAQELESLETGVGGMTSRIATWLGLDKGEKGGVMEEEDIEVHRLRRHVEGLEGTVMTLEMSLEEVL